MSVTIPLPIILVAGVCLVLTMGRPTLHLDPIKSTKQCISEHGGRGPHDPMLVNTSVPAGDLAALTQRARQHHARGPARTSRVDPSQAAAKCLNVYDTAAGKLWGALRVWAASSPRNAELLHTLPSPSDHTDAPWVIKGYLLQKPATHHNSCPSP